MLGSAASGNELTTAVISIMKIRSTKIALLDTALLQAFKFEAVHKNPIPTQIVIPVGPAEGMYMTVR